MTWFDRKFSVRQITNFSCVNLRCKKTGNPRVPWCEAFSSALGPARPIQSTFFAPAFHQLHRDRLRTEPRQQFRPAVYLQSGGLCVRTTRFPQRAQSKQLMSPGLGTDLRSYRRAYKFTFHWQLLLGPFRIYNVQKQAPVKPQRC